VPPEKLITEVQKDPAMPARLHKRTKGMDGSEELTEEHLVEAKNQWRAAAYAAVRQATYLNEIELAEEIVNRPLDKTFIEIELCISERKRLCCCLAVYRSPRRQRALSVEL